MQQHQTEMPETSGHFSLIDPGLRVAPRRRGNPRPPNPSRRKLPPHPPLRRRPNRPPGSRAAARKAVAWPRLASLQHVRADAAARAHRRGSSARATSRGGGGAASRSGGASTGSGACEAGAALFVRDGGRCRAATAVAMVGRQRRGNGSTAVPLACGRRVQAVPWLASGRLLARGDDGSCLRGLAARVRVLEGYMLACVLARWRGPAPGVLARPGALAGGRAGMLAAFKCAGECAGHCHPPSLLCCWLASPWR
jgi:hypothetical protein